VIILGPVSSIRPTETLDVRKDLGAGREPLPRIMEAADRLSVGESLHLTAPFEPKPLFEVLARRGFRHEVLQAVQGEWKILFVRERVPAGVGASPTAKPPCPGPQVRKLDLRGLEPPEPFVAAVEALGDLSNECILEARTDQRPVHLLDILPERGCSGATEELSDGSHLTTIRRG
jgi:uncharacterized protein (DUF2249 family)